jgi:23S rRNA (adenine2503-C2)-methyltransferase
MGDLPRPAVPQPGSPPPQAGLGVAEKSDKLLAHGLLPEDWQEVCRDLSIPRYRADQIWQGLYHQYLSCFNDLTTLPSELRARLDEAVCADPVRLSHVDGKPPGTCKLLLELDDGDAVETVLIASQGRRTVCLSTQAGCKFGCVFCASGQAGFKRNLQTGEIIGQLISAAREFGGAPSHVVFMGIGEPFDNYDPVMAAIRILNNHDGLNIGARRITISTVGVVPGIQKLCAENLQIELSVSLHAPNDEVRSAIMPINKRYPIDTVLSACAAYTEASNRIVTFEYTLIAGVNDSLDLAAELASRLSGFPCRVNLIRLNPIDEYAGVACSEATVKMFIDVLKGRGINATYRDSRGRRVNAACGQLRLRAAAGSGHARSETVRT